MVPRRKTVTLRASQLRAWMEFWQHYSASREDIQDTELAEQKNEVVTEMRAALEDSPAEGDRT